MSRQHLLLSTVIKLTLRTSTRHRVRNCNTLGFIAHSHHRVKQHQRAQNSIMQEYTAHSLQALSVRCQQLCKHIQQPIVHSDNSLRNYKGNVTTPLSESGIKMAYLSLARATDAAESTHSRKIYAQQKLQSKVITAKK